jgi:8-oxo-dGTP pyrophosphatase MutT (NUDIX family)
LEATAVRETTEEVGVRPEEIVVLGQLDDRYTITGFRIRPFVGLLSYPFTTRVSPAEIAELITLPLERFLHPDRFTKRSFINHGQPYPVYYFQVEGYNVWGATAKILKDFLELAFEAKFD